MFRLIFESINNQDNSRFIENKVSSFTSNSNFNLEAISVTRKFRNKSIKQKNYSLE